MVVATPIFEAWGIFKGMLLLELITVVTLDCFAGQRCMRKIGDCSFMFRKGLQEKKGCLAEDIVALARAALATRGAGSTMEQRTDSNERPARLCGEKKRISWLSEWEEG
jgi:hypothetical protein